MQAAAVHQGSEVLQVHLRAVQHLLDTEQGVLGGVHHTMSAQRSGKEPAKASLHPSPASKNPPLTAPRVLAQALRTPGFEKSRPPSLCPGLGSRLKA